MNNKLSKNRKRQKIRRRCRCRCRWRIIIAVTTMLTDLRMKLNLITQKHNKIPTVITMPTTSLKTMIKILKYKRTGMSMIKTIIMTTDMTKNIISRIIKATTIKENTIIKTNKGNTLPTKTKTTIIIIITIKNTNG